MYFVTFITFSQMQRRQCPGMRRMASHPNLPYCKLKKKNIRNLCMVYLSSQMFSLISTTFSLKPKHQKHVPPPLKVCLFLLSLTRTFSFIILPLYLDFFIILFFFHVKQTGCLLLQDWKVYIYCG